jgi:hypothetical protein
MANEQRREYEYETGQGWTERKEQASIEYAKLVLSDPARWPAPKAEPKREVIIRATITAWVAQMQNDDPDLSWASNIVRALLDAPMREDQLLYVLYALSEKDGHMKTVFCSICELTRNKEIV